MTRCLALLLLAVAAAADDLSLAGGYLPPARECPPAKTVTEYNTQYVTRTVVKPVVRSDVRYETQQVIKTSVVPSEIVRSSVRQVPSYVYRNLVETETKVQVGTKVLQVPGATRVVQKTVQKAEEKVINTDVYRTVYRTIVKPTTLTRTEVKTKVNVQTQYVPEYRVVYRTEYIPGPTQYVTKTEQVVRSVVQRVPQPAVYRTKYETENTRVYKTLPIPGPTVTKTVDVYKTQQVVKTEVRYSSVYVTYTEQQRVPVEKTITETQYDTRVRKQTQVKTKVVPRYYTKTQVVNVPQPVVVTNTDYVTKRIKSYPEYRTVKDTKVVQTTIPGAVRQETQYKVEQQTVVNTVYKTRVVPQYQTKTEIVKEPCGYSYDEPSNPLLF